MSNDAEVRAKKSLIERLWKDARASSDFQRRMAEDKSIRQTDNPERCTDLYSWPTPEQTLFGEAALALEATLASSRRSLEGEWVLVPKVPKEAMRQAGADQLFGSCEDNWGDDAARIWSAMISAAALFDEGREAASEPT